MLITSVECLKTNGKEENKITNNKRGSLVAILLGLTSCYNSPLDDAQSGCETDSKYLSVDGGKDTGSKPQPVQRPSDCREWVVGQETLTVCEYDANNDGKRDSIIQQMSNLRGIRTIKAYDTNGDGIYDLILSDESVLKMPETEIIPGTPNPGEPKKQEIFL